MQELFQSGKHQHGTTVSVPRSRTGACSEIPCETFGQGCDFKTRFPMKMPFLRADCWENLLRVTHQVIGTFCGRPASSPGSLQSHGSRAHCRCIAFAICVLQVCRHEYVLSRKTELSLPLHFFFGPGQLTAFKALQQPGQRMIKTNTNTLFND